MSFVEAHYAEALLSIAPSTEIADKIDALLSDFSEIMLNHGNLRYFLLNPTIAAYIKKDTVNKILAEDTIPVLVNFLSLLVDKDRLELLPAICREYRQLKNIHRKKMDIIVYSAEALEENLLLEICEKYRQQYGALTAEVHNQIEPSIIGGIRIKIGDICIDDTLSGRLKWLLSAIET